MFHQVAEASRILEGTPKGVTVGENRVGLFRVGDEIFALSDICTHAFALLSQGFQEGACVECPLHEGKFDVRTGKALCDPVEIDAISYAVKIENGLVFVDIP